MAPAGLARRVADIVLPPLASAEAADSAPLMDIPLLAAIEGLYRGRTGSPVYRLVAVDDALELEAGSARLPVEVVDKQRLRVSGVEITFASLDPPVMRMGDDLELDRVAEVEVADVAAFAGRYSSDETRTTLEVIVREGHLRFADDRPARGNFVAVGPAEFVLRGIAIRFVDGHMYLDEDEARNVRFARTD